MLNNSDKLSPQCLLASHGCHADCGGGRVAGDAGGRDRESMIHVVRLFSRLGIVERSAPKGSQGSPNISLGHNSRGSYNEKIKRACERENWDKGIGAAEDETKRHLKTASRFWSCRDGIFCPHTELVREREKWERCCERTSRELPRKNP